MALVRGSAHRRSGAGRDRYSNWRWPGIGPGDPGQIDKARWKVGIFWGLISAIGQGGGAVLSRKAGSLVAEGVTVDGLSAAYQRVLGGLAVMLLVFTWQRMVSAKRIGVNLRAGVVPAKVKWIILLCWLMRYAAPRWG